MSVAGDSSSYLLIEDLEIFLQEMSCLVLQTSFVPQLSHFMGCIRNLNEIWRLQKGDSFFRNFLSLMQLLRYYFPSSSVYLVGTRM